MSAIELPPLPEQSTVYSDMGNRIKLGYSAEAMRAYALKAMLQEEARSQILLAALQHLIDDRTLCSESLFERATHAARVAVDRYSRDAVPAAPVDKCAEMQGRVVDKAADLQGLYELPAAPQTTPASTADTAPIAKLTISDDGRKVQASLYAPGLPDGEHDVWPCPVENGEDLAVLERALDLHEGCRMPLVEALALARREAEPSRGPDIITHEQITAAAAVKCEHCRKPIGRNTAIDVIHAGCAPKAEPDEDEEPAKFACWYLEYATKRRFGELRSVTAWEAWKAAKGLA